jgi:hypothetical protein
MLKISHFTAPANASDSMRPTERSAPDLYFLVSNESISLVIADIRFLTYAYLVLPFKRLLERTTYQQLKEQICNLFCKTNIQQFYELQNIF